MITYTCLHYSIPLHYHVLTFYVVHMVLVVDLCILLSNHGN